MKREDGVLLKRWSQQTEDRVHFDDDGSAVLALWWRRSGISDEWVHSCREPFFLEADAVRTLHAELTRRLSSTPVHPESSGTRSAEQPASPPDRGPPRCTCGHVDTAHRGLGYDGACAFEAYGECSCPRFVPATPKEGEGEQGTAVHSGNRGGGER